ncbi:MAG TPA: hypothetical protein VMT76_07520 [Puia sp.]|nr:hypothetical protein [Puia sp.]
MKYTISILLFFVLVMQLFIGEFIILNYYLQKSAYIENCENRNKPELHCYGKCLLAKKINQAVGNEQKQEKKSSSDESPLSSKSFFASVVLPCAEKIIALPLPFHIQNKPVEPLFDIFHPPKCLLLS